MEQFQVVPIGKVFESPLNPRKIFNKKKMDELVESVRGKGVMVPLLVRPISEVLNGMVVDVKFEIAAGHRRIRAAIEVGLKEVPLNVREMNDIDFLEVLVIENDKHEDLEPLEQAQGYQALMKEANYDIPAIALKIAKSESYVYQRIKLLELVPEAQKLLTEGEITAGHAILIARLQPNEQKECLEAIKEEAEYGPGMSVRDLADHIETRIHLDLNSASFKKTDPDLVPEAGPCTTCQKRTGFAPALFPEIKKKDTCTDPSCFHKKVEAFTAQWIEKKSRDSDVPPLRLSSNSNYRMKKVPEGTESPIPSNLYHEITDKKKDSCSSVQEGIVVEGRGDGRVKLVCVDPECKIHHPRYQDSPDQARYRTENKAAEEKRKLAFKVREAILDATLKAWPGISGYSREDLLLLAKEFYQPIWHEFQKKILARKDLKPKKEQYSQNTLAPMNEWIEKQDRGVLLRFLLEIALFRELERNSADKRKDNLLETAKRYGVDSKKIEHEFRDQVKEKAEKKAKAKKKSPSVKQKTKRPDPFPRAKTIPRKDICKLHGPVKKEGKPTPGVCQQCGCTEEKPCEGGCAWTDKTKTLCTACQMAKEHHWEKQNLVTVAPTSKVPMHDIYKCKKCGATAKRFGVGEIRPDRSFTELKCSGPKKEVQTSAKKK